jgi:hypothetical protein
MARGTQLLQLVQMLRDETGRATSVAVGVDDLPSLKARLRRVQETLYDEHQWPHLRTVFDRIQLQAGERYYDFPPTLNFDRIEKVAVWDNGTALPIDRGIGFDEYSVYDSENDVRAEPATRWDVRWTGTKEQIEIWPVPSTNNQALQFIGTRKLRALVANGDVADLDDHMLVLFAAAELMPKDSPLAKTKLSLAQARFNRVKSNAGNNAARTTIGGGEQPMTDRGRVTVRVSR